MQVPGRHTPEESWFWNNSCSWLLEGVERMRRETGMESIIRLSHDRLWMPCWELPVAHKWNSWEVCPQGKDTETHFLFSSLPIGDQNKHKQIKPAAWIRTIFLCVIYEQSIGQVENKTLTGLKIDVQRTTQWLVKALGRHDENEKLFHTRLKLRGSQGLNTTESSPDTNSC